MVSDLSPEFDGVDDARDFLGVDQSAPDEEIKSTYQSITGRVGERVAVEAREIALADSLSSGFVVATVLCTDIKPDDITTVLTAQQLFVAAPPPENESGLGSYHDGIKRTADEAVERLDELQTTGEAVSAENIQAVRVGQYVLRYRDVEEGKRYVLDEAAADYEEAWRESLSPRWKYTVDVENETEYYIHGEKRIEVRPIDDDLVAYAVYFTSAEGSIDERFHRYGEAKRKAKEWIVSPPEIV